MEDHQMTRVYSQEYRSSTATRDENTPNMGTLPASQDTVMKPEVPPVRRFDSLPEQSTAFGGSSSGLFTENVQQAANVLTERSLNVGDTQS